MSAALVVSIASAAFSAVALAFSFLRVREAARANSISETSQWAVLVLKRVEAELENAWHDRVLVHQMCTVPFQTKEDKAKLRDELAALRDKSQHTIWTLTYLAGGTEQLQAMKADRDKVDDSFWENDELVFPVERGQAKDAEYHQKSQDYLECLRAFAARVSSNRTGLLLGDGKTSEKPSRKQLPSPQH